LKTKQNKATNKPREQKRILSLQGTANKDVQNKTKQKKPKHDRKQNKRNTDFKKIKTESK
jgi:hypothetical protein